MTDDSPFPAGPFPSGPFPTAGSATPVDPAAPELVTGDRLATDLLRAALGTDRTLVTRNGLAVCLRGAMFADLALAGALEHAGHAPGVTGTPPPEDRLLAAVHRTVERRPKVAWRRWYRHVDVDLAALTKELVADGRWIPDSHGVLGGRLGTRSYRDTNADAALALGRRARAIGVGHTAPTSPREAVLGVLAVSCGGGHGAAEPRAAIKLEAVLHRFDGEIDPQRLEAALAAVTSARQALPRRMRRGALVPRGARGARADRGRD